MHPIEHLRYVARARGADPVSLVRETAAALSGLGHEPAGIVLAVRRVIQRHPTCGPLWWFCSHLLGALDPFVAMSDCEQKIKNDSTIKSLREAVPQDAVVCVVGWPTTVLNALAARGDVKFFVAESNGDGDAAVERLVSMDVDATLVQFEELSRVASSCDVLILEALATGPNDVLCSAGSHALVALGYVLQKPVWLVAACGTRLPEPLWSAMISGEAVNEVDLMSLSLFSKLISKDGISDDLSQPLVAECPPTTELLRRSAM
jgi:hypothetical protein